MVHQLLWASYTVVHVVSIPRKRQHEIVMSMSFGDWVKQKRTALGLSQERLAQAAVVDRAYVNKIERGKIGLPLLDTRARFHKALGTTEDELVALGIVPGDATAVTHAGYARATGQTVTATATQPFVDEVVSLMRQIEWDERSQDFLRLVLLGMIQSGGSSDRSPMPPPDPDAP